MRQTLRPDQDRVVRAIIDARANGHRRILVYAPTGFGKTTVFAALAEKVVKNGLSCWVVVHRDELCEQARLRLHGQGVDAGVLMGTRGSTKPDAPAHVLGVQTVASRLRRSHANRHLPATPRVVFIDEAHHCISPSWRSVLDWAVSEGATVVMFTATPWDNKGGGLGVADALVEGPSPSQLRDMGVLVEPTIYCGPTPDLSGLGSSGGDFSQALLAQRTDVVVGDVVRTWQQLATGKKTLCFAVNVGHSQRLVAEWEAAGVAAVHVDGSTPEDERAAIFQLLEYGALDVVSNVGVVTEGFDCPTVEAVVLARPTQSEGLYVQMVGRGLRSAPGKTGCLILDHGYNALRHGHPMMDRPITLQGRVRWVKVKEDGVKDDSPHFRICRACMRAYELTLKACPQCNAPTPARKVTENRKLNLVKFTELDATQRDRVKVMERRAAWFRMEAMRPPGRDAWTTTYAYASRFGIMPHEDRIFITPKERANYWSKRKRGQRRAN